MSTQIEALPGQAPARRLPLILARPSVRYLGGVVLLAAAYYGMAKAGQAVRYTGSVSAVWPPAGLGIAALYLWGLRWWPGIFIGDLMINAELLMGHHALPLGSLVGQQVGNMAEILIGAELMRRLVGSRAELDRTEQVSRTAFALAVATAISATVGTVSMLAGGVIDGSEMPTFWRTWWLGDLAGALVVVPFLVVWARRPGTAWRRVRTYEGLLLLVALLTLAGAAVSTNATVTYIVFPVLIWAACRFTTPGATLAVVIVAGATIGMTAHHLGPFSQQEIDSRTLGTQVYISVAALTMLLLAAVVSEWQKSTAALVEAKRHEGEQALEERHRIARDLHDSVSQALFSTILQTGTAEKALQKGDVGPSGPLPQALAAIRELTRSAQAEMRGLIFDLRRDPVENGLVEALREYAKHVCEDAGLFVEFAVPAGQLPISHEAEAELFGIGREALSNVVKHARATNVFVRIAVDGELVLLEVRDDGCGFDAERREGGHYGLESMQGRAKEIGALLRIASLAERGTTIRIEAPVGTAASGA